MHLDHRHREQLDGVPDRVAVVRPRGRVEDDAVGSVERLVAPVDVLALAVRLPAADPQVELLRPLVDLRLELLQPEPAVQLRIAPPEHVEVDTVEHVDAHAVTLPEISASSAARTSASGSSCLDGAGRRRAARSAAGLSCRAAAPPRRARGRPRTGSGASTASTAAVRGRRGEAPPAARARPRGRAAARNRSRLRARGANVWPRLSACARPAVVGVAQAERGLVGSAPAHELLVGELPERLACEQPRLHHLGHAVRRSSRAASPAAPGRSPCAPASGTRRRGSSPRAGRSPVLPPIAASTCPTSVVGTATQSTPRM